MTTEDRTIPTTRTTVLDLTTMGHALRELELTYLGEGTTWQAVTAEQQRFLDWFLANKDEIGKLSGLEALAARHKDPLNSFLEARGFLPLFNDITGVGVASVLDMLVNWAVESTLTKIMDYTDWQDVKRYPAFTLPGNGADVFHVTGYDTPLACLGTKTGHKLWLMKADAPASGLDLALAAQQVLAAQRSYDMEYTAGVTVPMLDLDVQPDLNWMLHFSSIAGSDGSGHAISQAFQQFKLRLDDKGARVKVATGFATRGGPIGPQPYEFNTPFMGFFTQPGHDTIALAAFYADVDVWKKPEGSLEEL